MKSGKYRIKKYPGVYGYDSAKKRVNGKPDICYYILFKVDGKNRTEKIGWISEGYTGQLAAEVRAKRIREARHNGQVKTARDIRTERKKHNRTLNEIKNHYFNSERGKALKGRKTDLGRWKLYLNHLGTKSVPELSQLDIERIKRNLKQNELSPATIDHALRLLRRIINHGVKHDLCPALAFKIEFPRVHNTVTEFLTPEQAARLLDVLDNWKRQDIARMIKLAWFTGMRRGELFSLKTAHLDFTHDLITIADPKGGRNVNIPMSPPVKELLQQQIFFLRKAQELREQRYKNTSTPCPPWEENGYLFPGVHGKKRKDCSAINRIKEKARLPKSFRPFHGLRHHLAVTLASSGEYTLDMIGELLTHKDSSVTRRYASFLPEARKKAATRAAEILTNHTSHAQVAPKIINLEK
ncbi:MAG TPA: site-specific integrase [Desulfobulbaceae bacterium]|nr:site-specific integrase [Desulfobulbaceae bacterium]